MAMNLKVEIRDFSEQNTEKLTKIFQTIGQRERTYSIAQLSDPSDLLLVDIGERTYFDRQQHADAVKADTPIVTVGRSDKPQGSDYHIKGLLLATRVIRVLDQIEIPAASRQSVALQSRPHDLLAANNTNEQTYAYKVLVVDDSALMRKAITQELSRASLPLHIEFAETGEQALAKTSANHYDFVFLDVMMPGMDGYETCSQIRNTGGYKKTPIIMLSAKTSPMDEVKGIMSGCTNYVTKPIDADEFQHMLDRIMHWIGNYRKHQ